MPTDQGGRHGIERHVMFAIHLHTIFHGLEYQYQHEIGVLRIFSRWALTIISLSSSLRRQEQWRAPAYYGPRCGDSLCKKFEG